MSFVKILRRIVEQWQYFQLYLIKNRKTMVIEKQIQTNYPKTLAEFMLWERKSNLAYFPRPQNGLCLHVSQGSEGLFGR